MKQVLRIKSDKLPEFLNMEAELSPIPIPHEKQLHILDGLKTFVTNKNVTIMNDLFCHYISLIEELKELISNQDDLVHQLKNHPISLIAYQSPMLWLFLGRRDGSASTNETKFCVLLG